MMRWTKHAAAYLARARLDRARRGLEACLRHLWGLILDLEPEATLAWMAAVMASEVAIVLAQRGDLMLAAAAAAAATG